jgi:hypothetical protein
MLISTDADQQNSGTIADNSAAAAAKNLRVHTTAASRIPAAQGSLKSPSEMGKRAIAPIGLRAGPSD